MCEQSVSDLSYTSRSFVFLIPSFSVKKCRHSFDVNHLNVYWAVRTSAICATTCCKGYVGETFSPPRKKGYTTQYGSLFLIRSAFHDNTLVRGKKAMGYLLSRQTRMQAPQRRLCTDRDLTPQTRERHPHPATTETCLVHFGTHLVRTTAGADSLWRFF